MIFLHIYVLQIKYVKEVICLWWCWGTDYFVSKLVVYLESKGGSDLQRSGEILLVGCQHLVGFVGGGRHPPLHSCSCSWHIHPDLRKQHWKLSEMTAFQKHGAVSVVTVSLLLRNLSLGMGWVPVDVDVLSFWFFSRPCIELNFYNWAISICCIFFTISW